MRPIVISTLIALVVGILVGAGVAAMGPRTRRIGDAIYSVGKNKKALVIERNGAKLLQIEEASSDRIQVSCLNRSDPVLSFSVKLLPQNGLVNLSFRTPEDEAEGSRAIYNWVGSSYADDKSEIGIEKIPFGNSHSPR